VDNDKTVTHSFFATTTKSLASPLKAKTQKTKAPPWKNMSPNQTKRVGIYARVSTHEQNIEMQLTDLRRYSLSRGWNIHKEYLDEGISGSKASRPLLNALMADARRRSIDIVLVWRFDRFARSSKQLALALDEFQHLGIDFVSFQEQIDTSTPMGKMVFTLMGAVAELERNIIIERIHGGLRRAKEKGKTFGRPRVEIPPERLSDMQQKGYSIRKMAMALGVPRSTIYDKLANLKPPSGYPSPLLASPWSPAGPPVANHLFFGQVKNGLATLKSLSLSGKL
jgi:DNA invertase Pin-like site-specific DNA recombinase